MQVPTRERVMAKSELGREEIDREASQRIPINTARSSTGCDRCFTSCGPGQQAGSVPAVSCGTFMFLASAKGFCCRQLYRQAGVGRNLRQASSAERMLRQSDVLPPFGSLHSLQDMIEEHRCVY
jgi:hypothetical protein